MVLYFPSIQCGAGGARDHRPRGRNPPLAASLSPLGPRNRSGAWCARVVPCTAVLDPCATVDSLIGTSPSCRKTARGSAGILSSTLAKNTGTRQYPLCRPIRVPRELWRRSRHPCRRRARGEERLHEEGARRREGGWCGRSSGPPHSARASERQLSVPPPNWRNPLVGQSRSSI